MARKLIKIISIFLCFLLILEQAGFAQVAGSLDIAGHLAGMRNAFTPDTFRPLHLRYLSYNPQANNFRLYLDKGDLKDPKPEEIEETTKTLLSYFFIGISLPNDTFWVNLRPDSPDNIIDPLLAETDIGRILLENDLQLKKDTALATSPATPEGRQYWDKLYQKVGELFGSQNITIPTLTRPWIVPDEIIIRETTDSAYIYKATLKVMLEEDYLNSDKGRGRSLIAPYKFDDPRLKKLNEYSSQLIRELIIPKLTKEINTSKRYASLRQVYYSLILAQWFKARFTNSTNSTNPTNIVTRLIDRKILTNLTSKESWSKTAYFKQYQRSFKDGEYNIQEPVSTLYGQTVRSYFSGGLQLMQGQINRFGDKPNVNQPYPFPANSGIDPKPEEITVNVQAADEPEKVIMTSRGQMKPLGPRDPMDEDAELDLSGRHGEFEAKAVSAQSENVYGLTARVVSADLGNAGAYHFYSDKYGLIIVVNSRHPDIWEEGKFHEVREIYWMGDGFTQHEAHVIASAEQVQKFSINGGLTPYHAIQIENLSPELREALRKEDRTWHYGVLERANKTRVNINVRKIKYYEERLRETEEIKRVSINSQLDSDKSRSASGASMIHSNSIYTGHQNWIGESRLVLPKEIFGGKNNINLIRIILDVLQKVLNGRNPLIAITGSASYALTKDGIPDWDAITDIDVKIYEELAVDKIRSLIFQELKQDGLTVHMLDVGHPELAIEDKSGKLYNITFLLFNLDRTIRDDYRVDPIGSVGVYRISDLFFGDMDRLNNSLTQDLAVKRSADFYVDYLDAVKEKARKAYDEEKPKLLKSLYQLAYLRGMGNNPQYRALLEIYKILQKQFDKSRFEREFRTAMEALDIRNERDRELLLSDLMAAMLKMGSSGSFSRPTQSDFDKTQVSTMGGINFRSLPIVTQAMSNLSINTSRMLLSRLNNINPDQELREIQKVLEAGIVPSAERIKEYVRVSCLEGNQDMGKVISCIADILRMEEGRCSPTDPVLKDILVVLESGMSNKELERVFTGIK